MAGQTDAEEQGGVEAKAQQSTPAEVPVEEDGDRSEGAAGGQTTPREPEDTPVRTRESSSATKRVHFDDKDDDNKKGGGPCGFKIRRWWLVPAFVGGLLAGGTYVLRSAETLFPNSIIVKMQQMQAYLSEINIPSPNISLPVNISLPSVGLDVNASILNDVYAYISQARSPETTMGEEAAAKGWKAQDPIVLIPGWVTSGLEVWEGEPCAMKYFRQRMWTALSMITTMMLDPECWSKHMALNMTTGLDPDGIRLRPAQGLEAADYFMPGYWVWAKLIRDFAHLGYDHTTLVLHSYDWRLSLPDLEKRDRYFTRLKWQIELLKHTTGRKSVLLAHSYGSNVVLYFFKWVESEHGGKGGKDWVENHVSTFVDIAGPLLGVVKAATSYLSGEMHDTTELGPVEDLVFGSNTSAFNRRRRRDLFRTWGSLTAMLPKGGNAVWGNETFAPDDPPMSVESADHKTATEDPDEAAPNTGTPENENPGAQKEECASDDSQECKSDDDVGELGSSQKFTMGQLVGFSAGPGKNWTVEDVIDYLKRDDEILRKRFDDWYDMQYVTKFDRTHDHPKYWSNAMSLQLPKAPSLKIVCYYGVGMPTERSYIYKWSNESEGADIIDTSFKDNSINMTGGVVMADGDGTVSLLSLGYHCAKLWREKSHNPAGVSVTTRELPCASSSTFKRGGKRADHVDIMGNVEMAGDLLAMVSGNDEDIIGHDKFYSRIQEISSRVWLS